MSQLTLLEQYYKIWKKNQYNLKTYLMDLEANHQDLEDRISKLEAQLQDLLIKINEYMATYNVKDNWMKIKSFAINNKISYLLNPSKMYSFHITEIGEEYICVDKLGSKKLEKELFLSVINMLEEKNSWVKIGASVKNTKPDTIEGFIKTG